MKTEWQGIIKEYGSFLPISERTPVVTLFEGNTPLIEAKNLKKYLGIKGKIYLKNDGKNPTGSFKDRGMALGVAKSLENGFKNLVYFSTGNAAASLAAYSAKAGIKCTILIPESKVPLEKLSQALISGAKIIRVKSDFSEIQALTEQISQNFPHINTLKADWYLAGFKTAALEICDQLGDAPDYQFVPIGNGGNITAYWQGYKEYFQKNKTTKVPLMMGFQALGAAPIVLGRVVKKPKTVASAIQIGNPKFWQEALKTSRESFGSIGAVSDKAILEAYQLLAKLEGIFSEPAAAVSVAGLIKESQVKKFKKTDIIVCTLTGDGLKDTKIALKLAGKLFTTEPNIEKIVEIIEN